MARYIIYGETDKLENSFIILDFEEAETVEEAFKQFQESEVYKELKEENYLSLTDRTIRIVEQIGTIHSFDL